MVCIILWFVTQTRWHSNYSHTTYLLMETCMGTAWGAHSHSLNSHLYTHSNKRVSQNLYVRFILCHISASMHKICVATVGPTKNVLNQKYFGSRLFWILIKYVWTKEFSHTNFFRWEISGLKSFWGQFFFLPICFGPIFLQIFLDLNFLKQRYFGP